MFNEINLRRLADTSSAERAFLTIYLAGVGSDEFLERRARKMESLLKTNKDELEHFRENMRMVRQHLAKNPLTPGGLAIYACWALDFFEAHELGLPPGKSVADMIKVDSSPFIRPLAELQDEYEDFAVVVADNKRARIFLVASARGGDEESVVGDVKNHVKVGGWSQQRYERKRDKELLLYSKEIAARLADLDRESEFRRIVMVGSKETLAEIERVLPSGLQKKLYGWKAVDLGKGDAFVNGEIFDLFEDSERESETKLWDRIRNEYLSGGVGVAGADDILAATREGRVGKAVILRDLDLSAVRCDDCGGLAAGMPESCPYCGIEELHTVDLVNEIVEMLSQTGASADFVDGEACPGLEEAGGMAALLRW